ncbi:MAG: phytoene desaturase family protein [Candidatus Methylomirabilales bacterium]
MRQETDCLIVGSGLGALTCGTLLAQRGWRVLLLTERPPEDSMCWVQEGFEHDRSPDLLWGFEEKGVLHPVLAVQEGRSPVVRVQPGIQVVLSPHRVGFYGLGPVWQREIQREFPGSWRAILNCSERLCHLSGKIGRQKEVPILPIASWSPARLIGRRRLRPFLEGLGLPCPFCNMVEAVAAACFHVEPCRTTVAMAAAAFGHLQRGVFAPRGGTKAFTGQLISRFRSLGGEIREGVVGEVKRKWGAVHAVVMTHGEVVSCRYAVVESEGTPGNHVSHVLVDEALIPGEMRRNVLLVDAGPGEGAAVTAMHLAVSSADNPDDRPRQQRTVAIRMLQGPSKDMMGLLERVFPGWGRATICSVPPRRRREENILLSYRRLRPTNLLIISHESPLGCGLSAAARGGSRVAANLLARA